MASSFHRTYPIPPTSKQPIDANPKAIRLLFHTAAAGIMFQGFTGLQNVAVSKEVEPQYGGFFQYLTIIGLFAAGSLMILSAINDLLPAVSAVKTLKRVFLLFAMPVEIVISSIYWPIVLLTPELMFSRTADVDLAIEPFSSQADIALFRIPLWMDLSMHAVPAVVLLLDFFLIENRYTRPMSTVGATALAISFGSAYSLWVEYAATINGRFPYPFLTMMDPVSRVVLYVVSTFGALVTFWGLNAIHW